MLAHLLGGGSFGRRQPIRYASRDEDNLLAVERAAKHFGVAAVRGDYAAARVTTLRLPAPHGLSRGRRNPIAHWLDDLGLLGLRPQEKFIPASVFALPKTQVASFLGHLWSTDGSVTVDRSGREGRIYFASAGRRMLDDTSRLLLRFGITSRIHVQITPGGRRRHALDVSGRDDQLRFLREIGVHGERAAPCGELRQALECVTSDTAADTVHGGVWERVRAILTDNGMTDLQFAAASGSQSRGGTLWNAPSRQRLARVAAVLDAADLELHATNDVFWDEIEAIELLGECEVFDATVLGAHNFVANGIAVHNSIEQDADVVILLHRDDYYDKESPRAGEADFIVAKHRNGPTDTVTVAAQLHLARFVDMAIV